MDSLELRSILKPYISELLGTFFLCTIISWTVTQGKVTGAGEVTGLAIGMAVMVSVYITAAHSGGHINPAVSLAIFLSGDSFHETRKVPFSFVNLLGYWLMQFTGALLAGGVSFAMWGQHATTPNDATGWPATAGFPARGADVGWGSAYLVEMFGTCTLCLVVLNVATCRAPEEGGGGSANAGNSTFGLAIGSVIAAWAIGGGGISGGAYNPAVGTMPVIWQTTSDWTLYLLGPFSGAILAFCIFFITNPMEFVGEDTPKARALLAIDDETTEFFGTMLFAMLISLVGGSGSALGGVAIGLMLLSLVYMGGHISGGHYNPAVTLAVTLRGKCPLMKCPIYIACQSCGALIGGGIAHAITQEGSKHSYGFPSFGKNPKTSGQALQDPMYDFGQAFGAELLGTYILCITVLFTATCDKKNVNNSFYGLAIGFAVMISAYAFGPVSGGAFNPAVGLLPVWVGWDQQTEFINPESKGRWIGCYWSAPFVAAIMAAMTFWVLNPDEEYRYDTREVHKVFEHGDVVIEHSSAIEQVSSAEDEDAPEQDNNLAVEVKETAIRV